jgi:hypothetical protein
MGSLKYKDLKLRKEREAGLENCLINTSYRLIVFPSPVRGSG